MVCATQSRLKLYALFINGGNDTALHSQWFVMQMCPLI